MLGGLLRQLVEALDGAVDRSYRAYGLDYRARFTPIVRTLKATGPASVRSISNAVGVSHSAVSQTIGEMAKLGLVEKQSGTDRREHIIALTPSAQAMLPLLARQWQATEMAARTLDADLNLSLPDVLRGALRALADRPFGERIAEAASTLSEEDRDECPSVSP